MLAHGFAGGIPAAGQEFGLRFRRFEFAQVGFEDHDLRPLVGFLDRLRKRIEITFAKVNGAQKVNRIALALHLPERVSHS